MFDPFKDFATAGYLRNRYREQDFRIIKQVEHEVFVRNAPTAQHHLASKGEVAYADFLTVHRILFSETKRLKGGRFIFRILLGTRRTRRRDIFAA